MLSVAQQLKDAKADLFIVVESLEDQAAKAAELFMIKHQIKFELVNFSLELFRELDTQRYSNASLMRLCLNKIISANYDRVLYLDSDILALQPLSPLLDIDLFGRALGAVPEVKLTAGRGFITDRHRRQLGIAPNAEYFNSGVLLLDWHKTRVEKLLEKSYAMLKSRQDFKFLDQDVLNLTFVDNWHALPLKWNAEQSAICYLDVQPALRHFNHAAKPWDWPGVMGYEPFHHYYVQALEGLELSSFLQKKKTGNPVLANAEIYLRKSSFHIRKRLQKHFVNFL